MRVRLLKIIKKFISPFEQYILNFHVSLLGSKWKYVYGMLSGIIAALLTIFIVSCIMFNTSNREIFFEMVGPAVQPAKILEAKAFRVIIWIDLWMIVDVFITIYISLTSSLKSIRGVPLTGFILWRTVFWASFETLSTLLCSGILTGDAIYFFSICPHLIWPRIGLLILVVISTLVLVLHYKYNNKMTAWLSLIFSLILVFIAFTAIAIIIISAIT